MVAAQVSRETFTHTSHTPRPDPSDSDDVLLALETARALEAHGENREAARWLRRAADQAEQDGNDERVVVLARAAADLTTTMERATSPAPAPSSLPPSNGAERRSVRSPPPNRPPPPKIPAPKPAAWAHAAPPPARIPTRPASAVASSPPARPRSSVRPSTPARVAPASHVAPRSSSPSTAAPQSSAPSRVSPPLATDLASSRADQAIPEHTRRVDTIRVAIPVSVRQASVFVVRRLEAGQPLPAGTNEGMLVLADEGTSRSRS